MTVSMKQELISPLLMEARLTLAGQYEELVIRSRIESPVPASSITSLSLSSVLKLWYIQYFHRLLTDFLLLVTKYRASSDDRCYALCLGLCHY